MKTPKEELRQFLEEADCSARILQRRRIAAHSQQERLTYRRAAKAFERVCVILKDELSKYE